VKKGCSCAVDIPADTAYIGYSVEKIVNFLQTNIKLTEELIFEIKVILNELIINAVVHGNKKDKSKKVHIKAGICNNSEVYIIVEDEGEGIAAKIEDCNLKKGEQEELEVFCLNESGRGLAITSALCDCIKRNKKGNKVIILKKQIESI
jgi:serine/threonine-protein kinase RsbW